MCAYDGIQKRNSFSMKKLPDTTLLGVELPESVLSSKKFLVHLAIVLSIGITVWLWVPILSKNYTENTLYVLDVGQGDSQLVVLASPDKRSSVKILIDGGKDRAVLNELNDVLGNNDKYIDIVVMTHPDLDHFGGLVDVLRRYDVGVFVSNGHTASSEAYAALKHVLAERNIQSITLLAGDSIRYGTYTLSILAPDAELLKHKLPNEAGIVGLLTVDDVRVLLTADIGFPAENVLLKKKAPIAADILKVGHHGSKHSSSENFIAAVKPAIAVIGVGKNNYGHPAPRVLETLGLAGTRVYRTDTDGTIQIPLNRNTTIKEVTNAGAFASVMSILTGSYKHRAFTTVSLAEAREKSNASGLVAFKTCSFGMGGVPRRSPLIFSEIAWMGSESGATHEWIELGNVSGTRINLSGWQILNENERVHFTFPQKAALESAHIVLARSAIKESVGAKYTFTGSLRNTNEGLRLYDNECNLIDEIPVSSKWPAGDNKTKKTMERTADLSWKTSKNTGGTPGR